MLDAIRHCITASAVKAFSKTDSYRSLTHKDAFKLATLGGSEGTNNNAVKDYHCLEMAKLNTVES